MIKCECQKDPVIECSDCNLKSFMLSGQDVEDVMSALSFFIREYSSNGSTQTKKAMNKLLKKLWKFVKSETKEEV